MLITAESKKLTERTVSHGYHKASLILFFSASWADKNDPEPLLPGLSYSPKQLFWISAANVWCAKYRAKALKLRVLTGVHSPDKFRVQVFMISSFKLFIFV